MAIGEYTHVIIEFVRQHQAWAAPIVFALAFAESLAFISLLVPAWAALVSIGALVGASGISFWPICLAGGLGAALGDWVSYSIGFWFKDPIGQVWPLSKYPNLLPRGKEFMRYWGVLGIFVGRFFGPLRAAVPLAAGILEMPYLIFQLANFSSAFLWAYVLLKFGDFGLGIVKWFI